MSTIIVSPKSKKDIINLAQAMRANVKSENLSFDVCRFMEEDIRKMDPSFNYEYVETSKLPQNTYAYYNPSTNTIAIDENVYLEACEGNGRHRFTIAHEIGHYFTSDAIACVKGNFEDIPIYYNPEWQANVFASELLMPSDLIGNMEVEEIVEKFQVSKQAAVIALKNAKKSNIR